MERITVIAVIKSVIKLVASGFSLNFLKNHRLRRSGKITALFGFEEAQLQQPRVSTLGVFFSLLKPAVTSLLILPLSNQILAQPKILNIYAYSNYISDSIIAKFTKETGIKINLTEYDSNETMYAKLKASKNIGYDIIVPANYYIDRLIKQGMLHQIDKNKLTNFHNLNPSLLNKEFDPQNKFSIPYFWGTSGVIINTKYIKKDSITKWQDFWQPQYKDQLMMLNDIRDVFNVALLSLGYSVNDTNLEHITESYLKLKKLLPNIKIFNIDTVPNVYVDEDAIVGMAWNGDCKIAKQENPNLQYIYPQDGFVIWIDSFAILKNANHLENAYKFLNFMLKPQIAKEASLVFGFAPANLAAMRLMPKELQNDPIFNPDEKTMKRGHIQIDLPDQAKRMYEKYWEKLKIGD